MDEDFFKDYPIHDTATPTTTAVPVDDGSSANGVNTASAEPIVLGTADMAMGPPSEDDAQVECEAVMQWRMDFAKGLEEKIEKEKVVKREKEDKAKDTLRNMYANWERRKRENGETNLKDEKNFLIKRDGVIARIGANGDEACWSVVGDLVDLSGKFKEGARDTSRMRQVIMRMRE